MRRRRMTGPQFCGRMTQQNETTTDPCVSHIRPSHRGLPAYVEEEALRDTTLGLVYHPVCGPNSEARSKVAVLDTACFPSIQRCAVRNISSARCESGPTYSFYSSDTNARRIPAVRDWHVARGALDRVFEPLRIERSYQISCSSAIGAAS